MYKKKIISEGGFIDTIVNHLIDTGEALYKGKQTLSGRKSTKVYSISRSTKDYVLTFPVYISSSVSPKMMHEVSTALEKRYASLLLILFNSITVMNDSDMRQFISKFHINMGSEFYTESTGVNEAALEAKRILDDPKHKLEMNRIKQNLVNDLKRNAHKTLPLSISESGINGKCDLDYEEDIIIESKNKKNPNKNKDNSNKNKDNSNKKNNRNNVTSTRTNHSSNSRYKASLSNFDVKKENELIPIPITFNYTHSSTNVEKSFTVGVKTRINLIDSDTLIRKIESADMSRGLLNLVRATSREISFTKDLILSLDSVKADAYNTVKNKNSARELRKLKNRSLLVKLNRLTDRNVAQAISTMIISRDDAEILLQEYNVDVMNPVKLKGIMNKYSLLGFVICDEEDELVHFLFDGDEELTTLSMRGLSKNNSKREDLETLVTLMGKGI